MSDPADLRNRDWIELVKDTREAFGVSINEAHHLLLADPQIRRLVARRMNRDRECRKMAFASVRNHGEASPLERDGDRVVFRKTEYKVDVQK